MDVEQKYQVLLNHIRSMDNERNYYATFALFGDSLPDEIWQDARSPQQPIGDACSGMMKD